MTAVAAAPVVLSAGDLEATFVPERGMLGTSLRHRGAELLDRTGGIPLLHPWANRLTGLRVDSPLLQREEHGLPIHGLLMGWPAWELPVVSNDRLRARLDFGGHPELLAAFPFPHELELDVALRLDALTVTTTVTATGDVAVPVSFGYHPYLRLPGVPRAAWEVGFPARRHLVADERLIPTGAVEPQPAERFRLAARTFDDGYDGLRAGAMFTLAGGGRRIVVRFERGYPVGQVFAPAGEPFICFEPMTAPTNALSTGDGLRAVAPGDRFTAVFSIAVTATPARVPGRPPGRATAP
jgi:galactose mutarotase-like enzyme